MITKIALEEGDSDITKRHKRSVRSISFHRVGSPSSTIVLEYMYQRERRYPKPAVGNDVLA